ncbi:putative transcription factor C3H family [Helianthus annuus]|uniref:Putative zinc finger, CCCH-type n=1 Tax=Helianthus annuus TaxID=4232 RepID=A0A251RLQ0_HELAN|nr:zinc finger CCCH domain-containing protein 34 [Helianthus annuus]KAF5753608.1 putative transcription factor C3H family [Helianthus annuus]KAJ0445965.1 putative transcription factor C3H family [Helianthus annuus]
MSSPGDQTEPTWQLGLGGGSDSLPQRPDEADCIYYLRTGFCGYGSRCRFNHPVDRGGSVFGGVRSGGGEYPERIGEPVCQYYMRTGMCKFGASCKYHHPRHGVVGSSSTVPLNVSGYPLRPGEKECSYYVKTGQCKFGPTCKYHHPRPTIIMPPPPPQQAPRLPPESLPSALYPSPVASSQPYGVFARPSLPPGPYFPGPYGPLLLPPPAMVPFPNWNPYQAPASPNTIGAGPFYAIAPHLSPPVPSYTGSYLSVPSSSSKNEHSLPQRPGEPECQYYLKTGDCKFGSSCRYHHPPEWTAPSPNFVLSPMGLPLRPGAPVCTHYSQKGACRFGPSCKFDHPMGMLSYSSSASSLAEMPVAPYPVGLSIATLAPSSSSSNLRPDLISTANKDGSSSSKNMPVSDSTGGTSTTRGHST